LLLLQLPLLLLLQGKQQQALERQQQVAPPHVLLPPHLQLLPTLLLSLLLLGHCVMPVKGCRPPACSQATMGTTDLPCLQQVPSITQHQMYMQEELEQRGIFPQQG
jgi:hypothetical protein